MLTKLNATVNHFKDFIADILITAYSITEMDVYFIAARHVSHTVTLSVEH